MTRDPALAEAVSLLSDHGRPHDAIVFAAQALRESRDLDTALLLVLLLLRTGRAHDRRAAQKYLRRIQWQAPLTG